MAVIGNAPFQGLVSGGNILDASIEGVDLSTSAIAARLGYTPVDPGAAVFSANPTISSGTAGGVAYLNGSKVVTTGSALTYNGSAMQLNAASFPALKFGDSGATLKGEIYYGIGGNDLNIVNYANGPIGFSINSSEQMRLTSTGLGIGTSSPAHKLDVRGNTVAGNGTITTGFSWDTGGIVGTFSNHNLRLMSNLTIRATLDTSGNLGLGVTPSAWWSSSKAMQIGAGTIVQGRTGSADFAEIGANVFLNSSAAATYIATAAASRYQQSGGGHFWYTAPSGTAGNAISFTQAMTLDASGNWKLGTTIFGTRAAIYGANAGTGTTVTGSEAAMLLLVDSSAAANAGPEIAFASCYDANGSSTITGTAIKSYKVPGPGSDAGQYNHGLIFKTSNFPTGIREVARLDPSGNFTLGNGGILYLENTNQFIRGGGSTQIIVGASSGGFYQQVSGSYYLVTTAGGSTSDASLKTNVQQLTGALDKVCAIRGVNFEFLEQPMCTADQGTQLGVIAQEVEAQYPEIVLTNEDGKKTVRYDRLVAPLIEAIKEQQTIIQTLAARVAALESV